MPYAALSALALVCAAASANAQVVTFTDGEFDPANWTAFEVMDTTYQGRATFETAQVPSGGLPEEYRLVAHTYRSGALVVGHLRSTTSYDPSVEGPVEAMRFSYDLIIVNAPPGQAVGYGPLLRQNGSWYLMNAATLIFDPVWTHFTVDLQADSFIRIGGSGPAIPDFSENGSVIEIGYYSSNSSTGAPQFRESGIDNWTAEVIPVGTCDADFDGNGEVDSADLFAFLSAFHERSPDADFNGDGQVRSNDFFEFLHAFIVGCEA